MKKETYYIFMCLYVGTDAANDIQVAEVDGKPEARKIAQGLAKALGHADYTDVGGIYFEAGDSTGHESFKIVPDGSGEDDDNGGMIGW